MVYRLWPLWREHYWVPVFPDSCDSFSVCLQWHDHYNQGQIINCKSWRGGEACVFLANLPGFRNSVELIGLCHEWVSDVLWKFLQISVWLQGKWNCPLPLLDVLKQNSSVFLLGTTTDTQLLKLLWGVRLSSWSYRSCADTVDLKHWYFASFY